MKASEVFREIGESIYEVTPEYLCVAVSRRGYYTTLYPDSGEVERAELQLRCTRYLSLIEPLKDQMPADYQDGGWFGRLFHIDQDNFFQISTINREALGERATALAFLIAIAESEGD